jgi:RNA polymerase sigma-70 factor, ECF subfamily
MTATTAPLPAPPSSLVQRARSGDDQALEALLAAIEPTIQRFGRQLCRQEDDADDVTQETLLAMARHLGAFEERSSLTSWVFALARSACARRRRGLANRPHASTEGLPEPPDPAAGPEERLALREDTEALSRALAALPEVQRDVLFLRDLEGRSASETAQALGITVDAVKSRLHRARAALREALGEDPSAPRETE